MKKTKGFSMSELIVVVAVVGILFTIAVFYVRGARQNAYHAALSAEVRILANLLNSVNSVAPNPIHGTPDIIGDSNPTFAFEVMRMTPEAVMRHGHPGGRFQGPTRGFIFIGGNGTPEPLTNIAAAIDPNCPLSRDILFIVPAAFTPEGVDVEFTMWFESGIRMNQVFRMIDYIYNNTAGVSGERGGPRVLSNGMSTPGHPTTTVFGGIAATNPRLTGQPGFFVAVYDR